MMKKSRDSRSKGQKKVLNRRTFIKEAAAGAAGGLLIFAVGCQPYAGREELGRAGRRHEEGEYDMYAHFYSYVIDTHKCIGCGMCVQACKRENNVPDGFYRTWVERYLISETQRAEIDSPAGGLYGFGHEISPLEITKAFFVPKMCNHCQQPPCVQVCPVGATYITKDGTVLVDHSHCIGCGYCIQACPYGARFMHPVSHTADKCTWCYHRIVKGLKPMCVQACPVGARIFGDLKKRDNPIKMILAKERVEILQPEMLTKPKCYYIGLDKEVR